MIVKVRNTECAGIIDCQRDNLNALEAVLGEPQHVVAHFVPDRISHPSQHREKSPQGYIIPSTTFRMHMDLSGGWLQGAQRTDKPAHRRIERRRGAIVLALSLMCPSVFGWKYRKQRQR